MTRLGGGPILKALARETFDRRLVAVIALLALGVGAGVAYVAHLRVLDGASAKAPGGGEPSGAWLARKIRGYDAKAFEALMAALTSEPVRVRVLAELARDLRLVKGWEEHQREQGRDLPGFIRRVQDRPEGQLLLERLSADSELQREVGRAHETGERPSEDDGARVGSTGGRAGARDFRPVGSAAALPAALLRRLSAQQQAFLTRRTQEGAGFWDACLAGGVTAACAEGWGACQAEAGCAAWAREHRVSGPPSGAKARSGALAHEVGRLAAINADYQEKDARANLPSWFNELMPATKQSLYAKFDEVCINGTPPVCDPAALCAAAGACPECEQAAQLAGQPFSCGAPSGTGTETETTTPTGTDTTTTSNTGTGTNSTTGSGTDTGTPSGTGTGTGTRPDDPERRQCDPGPNCLAFREIIVKERCPGPQRIYRARGNCCSCKISCYNAGSNHSSYDNTGVACRSSSCNAGRYQIHFCTD